VNVVHNLDCLPAMREMADNQFDLAIVDPPYQIADNPSRHGGTSAGKLKNRVLNRAAKKFKAWDNKPTDEYFDELFRVSKNQIICGGNYFNLPISRGFVVWDKKQPFPNFSRCEYLWLSFQVPSKIFEFDNRTGGKIHPTQKPIELYKWLLNTYAKEGNTILDTHVGSGSSRIACWEMGYDFTGFEIDKDYWLAQENRFKTVTDQGRIF